MKERIITTIVTLAVFIPMILNGGWVLTAGLAIIAAIALLELLHMKKIPVISFASLVSVIGLTAIVLTKQDVNGGLSLLAEKIVIGSALLLLMNMVFSANRFTAEDAGVAILGMVYIGAGFRSFILVRETGIHLLLLILFVVWSTDTFAYLVGRKIGKNKLAPRISPNKTIEGSVGGTVAAMIVAAIYLTFNTFNHSFAYMMAAMFALSIIGQMGDLAESAMKRFFGVKDSGKILPGHGGLLDRFDSLLFAMTFAVLFNLTR